MRYDLHVHTHHSKCSGLTPELVLTMAKREGLNGIAITDHQTIQGALQVKKLNKDKGFEVVVGEEVMTDKGEILAYYLEKSIPKGTIEEVLENARIQGAIVALAHPTDLLRKHFSAETVNRIRRQIYAVETFNSRTLNPGFNDSAFALAKRYRLASIAGSDAHFSYEIGGAVTLVHGSLRESIRKLRTTTEGSSLWGPVGMINTFIYQNFLRSKDEIP